MFVCIDCGKTFDAPVKSHEKYECWGSIVYQEYECCPYCYGWAFEEYDPYDYEEEEQEEGQEKDEEKEMI